MDSAAPALKRKPISSCDQFCSPRKTATNGPKPARLAATKKLTVSRARIKLPATGKALVLNDWVVAIVISAALPSACAIAYEAQQHLPHHRSAYPIGKRQLRWGRSHRAKTSFSQ